MNFFRKTQKQLSLATVLLLLGGWISIACQNCMANTSMDSTGESMSTGSHCDKPEPDTFIGSNTDFNKLCLENCDCDNHLTSINVTKQNDIAINETNDSYKIKNEIANESYLKNKYCYFSNNSNPGISRLTPVELYTIQIK